MSIGVTVLRVFTDAEGTFCNPLGVVDADTIPAADRHSVATQLAFSETVFVGTPAARAKSAPTQIYTPAAELPFAGLVLVDYAGDIATLRASVEWAPEFVLDQFDNADAVLSADPEDFSDDFPHYVWAWTDEPAGCIRARSFSPEPRCGRG